MTPSQQAKAAGLTSLRQVSGISGVSERTLHDWHRDKPTQFEITILGCVEKLKQDMEEDEKIAEARADMKEQILQYLTDMADNTGCPISESNALNKAVEMIDRAID